MIERICPSCGERVTDERARYCPICAAALPETAPTDAVSALEETLRCHYRDYIAWVVLSQNSEGFGKRLMELVIGNSKFKNSEKHEAFFAEAKETSEALLRAYRAAPGAGDPAGLLRYVLIDCHNDAGRDADWMLLVAEQLYLPFLELLTGPEAAALYEPYKALRKMQRGLDTQAKILKTLKTMSRG